MFWELKPLDEMTEQEWESLCDGCAICCLEKIEEEATGKISFTSIACKYLDIALCKCTIYKNRLKMNPRCIQLSPESVKVTSWLPKTCAYRRLAEGRKLQSWHPLISGDPLSVYESGISVHDKVLSGKFVHPEEVLL